MQTSTALRAVTAGLFATWGLLGAFAHATPPSSPPKDTLTLAPVVVTGVVPGPALWKVSKNGHVMWVLGITSPLPKHMQWDSTKVDHLIADSQQVLELPGYALYMSGSSGESDIVGTLEEAKELPAGETLQQILPPGLYSRWVVARHKYLHGPRGWGVDRLRPVLAATKLYDAALDQSDLTPTGMVEEAVYSLAARHWVRVTRTEYVLKVTQANRLLSRFTKASMRDQGCMRSTLDAIDQDFPRATALANAWATGNLPALRKLLVAEPQDPCFSDFSEMWGIHDMPDRVRHAWIAAAREALAKNVQSIALLPMEDLMKSDGYLGGLERNGYTVQAPASLAETDANP